MILQILSPNQLGFCANLHYWFRHHPTLSNTPRNPKEHNLPYKTVLVVRSIKRGPNFPSWVSNAALAHQMTVRIETRAEGQCQAMLYWIIWSLASQAGHPWPAPNFCTNRVWREIGIYLANLLIFIRIGWSPRDCIWVNLAINYPYLVWRQMGRAPVIQFGAFAPVIKGLHPFWNYRGLKNRSLHRPLKKLCKAFFHEICTPRQLCNLIICVTQGIVISHCTLTLHFKDGTTDTLLLKEEDPVNQKDLLLPQVAGRLKLRWGAVWNGY